MSGNDDDRVPAAATDGHEARLSLTGPSAGPRYQQVRQDLLAAIRRGDYQPGDRLPSENQICAEYGVSVTTARRALFELVKEGIVFRQPGVGTMVAPEVRQMRLAVISIGQLDEPVRRFSAPIGELVAGIGACTWERDASFTMTGLHADEAAAYLHRAVRERAVDGVLLQCSDDLDETWLTILEEGAMPYVAIKRHIPGRPHNCVVVGDVRGGQLATSHLIARQHRRIGFVCAKPGLTISRERLAGYRQALQAHQIAYDAALVRTDFPSFDPAMGYRAVSELLALPEPPTAIFVASDHMALGAYEAIRDAGRHVGQDLAIVGYDDFTSAALLQPPLTTIRASYFDVGQASAKLLIDLIDGRVTPPVERTLEPVLIVRESAGEQSSAARGPLLPETGVAGRLTGERVLLLGVDGPARRAIAERLATEGATVAMQTATRHFDAGTESASAVPGAGSGTSIVVADLGNGSTDTLDALLAAGRAAIVRLDERHAGRVLLVATRYRRAGSSEIGTAAVRGGVAAIVRQLGAVWSKRAPTVNAIVYDGAPLDQTAALDRIAGSVAFFVSPDASHLRGETIVIRG